MPRLDISLDGHLLIAGGQASTLGVDLATTRRFEDGRWVPYIPATAVRGAVRIRLESLLRGPQREVAGPYPLDPPGAGAEPDDPVARLFGYSGPEGERTGSREGCLRISDALPLDPERAIRSLRVRHGVEIDDATASVEEQKLFSRELLEVSTGLPGGTRRQPLVFRSWLEIRGDADERDVEWLRKAVATTFSIGAGKSTGGGEVAIKWVDGDEPLANRIAGDPAAATRARLSCTLLEPAHFGDGGARGNHAQTKTYIPGATLRGAIAWAFLRSGEAVPEDEGFRDLFLEPNAASFGDALPVPDPSSEPAIRPATLRERRVGGGFEDVLVRELARLELNSVLQEEGLYLRADVRHLRPDPVPARPAPGMVRRTRTRVSIDRQTGTSAEGKLFSIEQIEPWAADEGGNGAARRVTFVSWIEGLTPRGAELLAKLERVPVLVGAGRNHGMGKVAVEVSFHREPDRDAPELDEAEQKVLQLDAAVADRRREMAAQCLSDGGGRPLTMALVALSEFLPTEEVAHPLAACEDLAGEPVRRFLTSAHSGGYDQRPGKRREPLKTLRTAVGAGSVFVYRIDRSALRELIQEALPALRRGVGRRGESGCGRFDLFQEITP